LAVEPGHSAIESTASRSGIRCRCRTAKPGWSWP